MNPEQRVVTRLPLTELWTERGPLVATRVRMLGRADVIALLQSGPIQFLVADAGLPLRWIPKAEYLVFWKADVRDHLVEHPERPFDIYHFRDGYAYVASEWVADGVHPVPVVLLERHH